MFHQLKLAAEKAADERNAALKKILQKQRFTAGFLKALHHDVPRRMGAWGFNVDSSPQRKKKEKPEGA